MGLKLDSCNIEWSKENSKYGLEAKTRIKEILTYLEWYEGTE